MLEIACFTPSSATTAARSGAHRIELCASYSLGGTTPSLSALRAIRQEIGTSTPIHVMLRPRGGDFVYTDSEFADMERGMEAFLHTGLVDGFVFGVLDAAGCVDVARNAGLVARAGEVPCTFHRAVDAVLDLEGAVDVVVRCGFKSVLMSGGAGTAEEGVERVRAVQERFGGRISVVLGGGVRSKNVVGLKKAAGVEWVHSAAITGEGEEVDGEEVANMVRLLGQG